MASYQASAAVPLRTLSAFCRPCPGDEVIANAMTQTANPYIPITAGVAMSTQSLATPFGITVPGGHPVVANTIIDRSGRHHHLHGSLTFTLEPCALYDIVLCTSGPTSTRNHAPPSANINAAAAAVRNHFEATPAANIRKVQSRRESANAAKQAAGIAADMRHVHYAAEADGQHQTANAVPQRDANRVDGPRIDLTAESDTTLRGVLFADTTNDPASESRPPVNVADDEPHVKIEADADAKTPAGHTTNLYEPKPVVEDEDDEEMHLPMFITSYICKDGAYVEDPDSRHNYTFTLNELHGAERAAQEGIGPDYWFWSRVILAAPLSNAAKHTPATPAAKRRNSPAPGAAHLALCILQRRGLSGDKFNVVFYSRERDSAMRLNAKNAYSFFNLVPGVLPGRCDDTPDYYVFGTDALIKAASTPGKLVYIIEEKKDIKHPYPRSACSDSDHGLADCPMMSEETPIPPDDAALTRPPVEESTPAERTETAPAERTVTVPIPNAKKRRRNGTPRRSIVATPPEEDAAVDARKASQAEQRAMRVARRASILSSDAV